MTLRSGFRDPPRRIRLPRRLTTRMSLAVVVIVVAAGSITAGIINQLLVHHLRSEAVASGRALTWALGESLANPLVTGDLVAVQEIINDAMRADRNIVYAFAFTADSPVVHTFPGEFPRDLLQIVPVTAEGSESGVLLRTERGLVRDFGVRPVDGLVAEVHMGISQDHITAVQRQVTGFVLALTVVGCLLAAAAAQGFGRVAMRPLTELTGRVRDLGRGRLNERIDLPGGDEVGDLAEAFNQMATEIEGAIGKLRVSEAGYGDLLTAAGTVGEGIALICDDGPEEGTFLFANETFARLAGYRSDELLGVNAAAVLHPESLATARVAWDTIRRGDVAGKPGELTLVDRRGRKRILETAGTMIEYQGRHALAWFTRDITERKRSEEELRRRNRELLALNAVASAMSTPLPADEMLSRVLQQALDALELEVGWIVMMDENGGTRLVAGHGFSPQTGEAFAFPACRCGDVLVDGKPVLIGSADENCALRKLPTAGERPLTCHATVPVPVRGRVAGVLTVAAAGRVIVGETDMALLEAVARQIGVVLENAGLWEELRSKEKVRGELLARVIGAQEDERQRIARELHDGLGQSLNALVLGLNTVSTVLSQAPDTAPELLERLRVSASETVKDLQEVIYDLRPALLDDLGLCRALSWYTRERLGDRGVQVSLDVPEDLRLAPEVETVLFRIAQEAVTNVIKHAFAENVEIVLGVEATRVRLGIEDDGVGFDPRPALAADGDRAGWGLLGIQERVTILGGDLLVESRPGSGTRLEVVLPLESR